MWWQILSVAPDLVDQVGDDSFVHSADALVASILAKSPAMIDAVTDSGWSAMHSAAGQGHLSVSKLLLAASLG